MPTLKIQVEVEITDFDCDTIMAIPDSEDALEAQADFVKDALRAPSNKITWSVQDGNWITKLVSKVSG